MVSGRNDPPPMAELGVPPAYGTDGKDDPLPHGLYILTNKMSRTVLDLNGGSSSGGTRCYGYSRNTNDCIDHQLWIIEHNASNNTYTIKNFRGGTYLDLQGGKRENGSQVTCYPRSLVDRNRKNQEWRIIEQAPDEHTSGKTPDSESSWDSHKRRYRIRCTQTNTYLEIFGGSTSNGIHATCSAKVDGGAHQLWSVERVSRTAQEIKALLKCWKPDIVSRLFQPYGDDAEYFVLPPELRKTIWDETKLQRQTVRKHVFDYDDFVIKAKDAVSSWARDRLRLDEYSVLFGVVYGNAKRGPKAYNWYLSNDMYDLMFFDAQTGREYTPAAVKAFEFEPTFATF